MIYLYYAKGDLPWHIYTNGEHIFAAEVQIYAPARTIFFAGDIPAGLARAVLEIRGQLVAAPDKDVYIVLGK